MSEHIPFEASMISMEWGTKTYTVLPLPHEVDQCHRAQSAKWVEGELNDHPVNLAFNRAPDRIAQTFVWTGRALLDHIDVGHRESFEARPRPVNPGWVEVPADVTAALRTSGVSEAWDSLTAGAQRGHLHRITTAKQAETRVSRIQTLIAEIG